MSDWDASFCGCCSSCCRCLYAFVCPCCHLGEIATQVDEDSSPTANCLLALICFPTFLSIVRTAIRQKFNIRGGFCQDIVASCFCPICVQMQIDNQLGEAIA
eukprot:m.46517 g.46517  ORF g.46517 m.46517 type:complete len:102 (+) comp17532_c0_seq1:58-363(+)